MSDNSEAFEDNNKSEMLEDEEMPTFISVSSKEISLPYPDANIELLAIDNNSANPLLRASETADEYEARSRSPTTEERDEEGNDDNEEGSVYVLSSGDDADDADPPSSRSYDEDVDEEEDVDDEDDEDIDDMDEMEGEDEEVGVAEDGQLLGDFSEEEMEKEDVMSDDMALRSDKPAMEINHQRRSQSLQDLSEYGAPQGRKSFISGGNKYSRVQSKVKRYIQDLKERSRRSAEIRLKAIEDARKSEEFEIKASQEEEEAEDNCEKSSTRGRRSIKDYAEQAIKDLEMREELSQAEEEAALRQETENCVPRPNNNSQNEGDLKTEKEQHQGSENLKCGFKTASEIYRAKKLNMNGEATNEALKNCKIPKGIAANYTLNGQTQGQNILDVRSIGYDEYMRGSSNSNPEKNVEGVEAEKKLRQDAETQSPKSILEITNVRSEAQPDLESKKFQVAKETPMEVVEREEDSDTIIEPEANDSNKLSKEALAEIAIIQTQLNQKTTQCKEFREAYEKTLSENFELKQELENLRKTVSKLTAKKPAPELVAVAIQTDPPPPPAPPAIEIKDIPAPDHFVNPKLSSSSMGSAISANEHWTESAGSLPMSNGSIRPLPNLTPLSNAEDSFIGVPSTPPRTPRQPSHAFQTSSKIIKMLSSITRRKTRADGTPNGDEYSPNITSKAAGISSYHSPPKNRVSNKRKASEMPENASFLQPPKIPHTANSSHRSHRRTKSEFKFPGDYVRLNSQPFANQPCDPRATLENLDDSRPENDPRDDLDSGVKCFTFHEDENLLERSFLIQAEDEEKIQDSSRDAGRGAAAGVVRECGPYLLGNVEVRMTEVNGTINIWGKEVSQETNAEEEEAEEETDIDEELNDRVTCDCWHKTPNARQASNVGPICSTNKKFKIPPLRLSESGYLKNCHSPSTSGADNFRDRQQNTRNSDLEGNCNSRVFHKLKRFSNFQEDEAPPNATNNCGCDWDNENCDYTSFNRASRRCHGDPQHNVPNIRGAGRCSRLDSSGEDKRRSKTEENLSRNQSSRFANNFEDDNVTCRHGMRKSSAPEEEDDVFKRPSTSNARVNDSCCRNDSCRSHSPLINDRSNDPLLSHHPHEPPETRRRRSSGKRVRGILMDFFRGCGDCSTTNGPANKVSPSIVPKIRVRPSTPPPLPLLSQTQRTAGYGSNNERCVHTECCSTCAKRIEKSVATEIKSQLEIFGAEMERLHSRSQALLGMLNTLHSADTN